MAKSWKRSNAAHMRSCDSLYKAAGRHNVSDRQALRLFAKAAYHQSVAESQKHCHRVLTNDEKKIVYDEHIQSDSAGPKLFIFKRK